MSAELSLVVEPVPVPKPPCNQTERECLAQAAWLLAATTDVKVTVTDDRVGKLYKVSPASGLSHEIGTRHWLVVRFTRGKDDVRVSLKERGIYRTTLSWEDMRIGSAVIIPEVLGAFLRAQEWRAEKGRRGKR